ncbi:putative indole-3-pyruvate monooxygenase YUCCA4 [Lasiodiplodia hormozganensis]|uniref:Indole-3-pyruvate monooxygenase YUCCA4 n=1 Tax=Lasiodiplodia hormozganensis TaxID=869390 RepID=A0AA39Y891_9PEZI|nr:putative indole-3-pyruvate monooxygenase YUCCA4 [Lasiodiplodia hormozganensis]
MLATDSLHTIKFPTFTKPEPALASKTPSPPANPTEVASKWLTSFAGALSAADLSASLPTVLHADCWWRDHLALGWDLRTVRGLDALKTYVGAGQPRFQLQPTKLADPSNRFAPAVKSPVEGLEWVESMFEWETSVGRGKGMLRLVLDGGEWKAYMLYTALQELKGFEDKVGVRRPHGGNNSLVGGVMNGGNWTERRERQREFVDEEPQVVCVGAGQSGLNIAARLQAMGVSCLLIDRNKRVGDNWRCRYRTLVTHDPVNYTHMAYMPFPSTWPLFTPKDKLGDWFEAYATLLELNVWLSTTITSSSYSDATHTWTITVNRGTNGQTRTLHPHHVIFCTGHSGEPKIPTFPGQSDFAGTVYHGSQHADATASGTDLSTKKVVVVGTGNSGHDIAQNYHEAGAASVTMVQRRGTYVISAAEGKGIFAMHQGLYDEFGPPTEDADVFAQSLPAAVQFALHVPFTTMVREELERETVEGLTRNGFVLDWGPDGSGLFRKYITRGGGYYIDVGCSKLICDGKVKVANSPDGIKGFEKDALVLADGRRLEADIVVLATGYDNMRTSVAKALGKEQADRCQDVWDLDREGEINAMWRPSGHPGLWFMGGNLALCRIYSKFLALQIKAVEEGLNA